MISKTVLLAISLGVVSVAQVSAETSLVVLESLASPPARFTSHGPAPPDSTLTLRVALKQNDIAGLEETLLAVSTPGNAQYGAWLSRDDVTSYVRPTAETYGLVESWIQANELGEIKNASFAGDWVQISVPVSKANTILNAKFETFVDAVTGQETIRTLSYSIPASLQGHVNLIHPTVNFPIKGTLSPTRKAPSASDAKRTAVPASCQNSTTPACIQDLYGLPTALVSNPSKLSIWIPEYEANWMDSQDLSNFLSTYRPDISDPFPAGVVDFAVISVDNGTNINKTIDAGLEAALDFEYTAGLASGVPLTMVSAGPAIIRNDTQFLDLVLDTALYMVGVDEAPTVVSTSYGGNENDITLALATSICNTFMQLGARGSSVIFASGDGGVAGNSGADCNGDPFVPVFPATCPYVTSVGGTQLTSDLTEVVVNSTEQFWAVSGGFSTLFPRPAYQDAAVEPYLAALGDTYAGLYNASGRGWPDVSTLAVYFAIDWLGESFSGGAGVGGTSAAAPTFASIVALLNDARLFAGMPLLGFLNPLLYSAGNTSFTDVLEGNNPGCGTTGFNAGPGWDPVSGLGTPRFAELLDAALSA